jgi:thiol-disulfide isomerase/thioredoxin
MNISKSYSLKFIGIISFIFFLLPVLISAQGINKLIIEEKSGKAMAIGICERTVFADTNFAWWYNPEYENYEPNKNDIDAIASRIAGVKIKIVFGTWCSDSRREVPRFLKILDSVKFNPACLQLICVDRNKSAEGTEVDKLGIELVPTFIIYKDEKEIGRIVETPRATLEEDLEKILDDCPSQN